MGNDTRPVNLNKAFRLTTQLTGLAREWLLPGICLVCGLDSGRPLCLCQGCEEDLPLLSGCCSRCAEPMVLAGTCGNCLKSPPAFSCVYAPFVYGEPIDRLVLGLKHRRQLAAAEVLGRLLAKHIQNHPGDDADVILPMPLHWRRRFARGYNQARELAFVVSRETGIPMHAALARRMRHTAMQQQFSREHRRRNLRDAFVASASCRGRHIAVVDDVMTTGSTARELAKTLMRAGAADVQIWCVARTALEN